MLNRSGKRASAGNRFGMAVVAVVVCVLIAVMLMRSHSLKQKISTYRDTNQKLSQAIDEEMGRAEELQKLPDYVKSDAFIEKTAREKFGLAYENEIVFRAED